MSSEASPALASRPPPLAPRSAASVRVRVFDIGVGLLLPVWLLGLERILFAGESGSFLGGTGILGDYRPAAYAGTAGFTLALASWLALGRAASFLSGVLVAGACFALCVGACLLPMSLFGILFMGLGLLGLSPFLMVWVYCRCAHDAWTANDGGRLAPAMLGFLLALALPLGAQLATQHTIARALALIEADAPDDRQHGIELLRAVHFVYDGQDLITAYEATGDATRKQRLAEAFRGMRGEEIEDWLGGTD